MKKQIIISTLILATGTAFSQIFTPFAGWDYLTERSPEIVIARCTTTPQPAGIINSVIESDIEVVSVLKGSTKSGMSHMRSWYWPKQDDRFLMFANFYSNNGYTAVESYQIVPLNRSFQTNDLAGKTLKKQVQLVLDRRLKDVKVEITRNNEEKARLEQELNKGTNAPPAVPQIPHDAKEF
jgi:hypothetical protein